MKIAVIGSGVAGLVSAWLLGRKHEVTLFEADERLGGHTHTHRIVTDAGELQVDTGFIVHTPVSYPLFANILGQLRVETQPTQMTFSVTAPQHDLEYNAGTVAQIFAQPRNLLRGPFLRMLNDILRFFRDAKRLLDKGMEEQPLGPFLRERGYSQWFIDYHLNPMVAALWSASPQSVDRFPALFLARFMRNHFMLQATGRPDWRVIKGGSSRYIEAMVADMQAQSGGNGQTTIRTAMPIRSIARDSDGVELRYGDDLRERFDQVVIACHSDQSLALLSDADRQEREVLGAIEYQHNETVLHRDRSLLPQRERAWAAWNAFVPEQAGSRVTVTYSMNILQSLPTPEPILVTLNRSQAINADLIDARIDYHHPIFTVDGARAQQRVPDLNGKRRTWFCGAWTGFGFHEDGVRSAVQVAEQLGVKL